MTSLPWSPEVSACPNGPNHSLQTSSAVPAVRATSPATTRTPLRIGGVVPELLDPTLQDSTVTLMKTASLADTARVTVTWDRNQTAIDDGLMSDLRNGIDKARTAGIDVYLDAYPNG